MKLPLIFIVITLLSVLFFYYGTGKDKRVLLLSIIWILVVGIMAYNGYFENISGRPPRFLFVLFGAMGLSVYFYKVIDKNRLHTDFLMAVHTLRLPVELVLYRLFLQKQVPELMTFRGWNFDILMGISAICILIYFLWTKEKMKNYFFMLWHITGLVLLTLIVLIAILSSPLPVQLLAFGQPNIAVLSFPFVYLPAYIVPVVYLSHILPIQMRRC